MQGKQAELVFDFIRDRQEQLVLEKCALLSAMEYFLLFKGNLLSISHLYTAMGLNDNERLIRLLQKEGRGRSYLAGVLDGDLSAAQTPGLDRIRSWMPGIGGGDMASSFSGRKEKLSFATQIYEDILKLAAEEIVDRHNRDLRLLACYFVEGAMDEDSDPDRVFEQYYRLFLYLDDPQTGQGNAGFAQSFYHELFPAADERQKAGGRQQGMKSPSQTFAAYLRSGMAGTEFEKGHYLEKTTQDMLQAMARFLGVPGPVRVYSEVRRFHPRRLAGAAAVGYMSRQAGLFEDVLASYHIPPALFAGSAPDWTDRKIYAALEDILASCYLSALLQQQREGKKGSGRQRPDLKYFPAPAQILEELYHMLLSDALLGALGALQEDYYRNFSFEKITRLASVRSLEEELREKDEKMRMLEQREQTLTDRIRFLEKLLKEKDQDLEAVLRDELSGYDKKLEELGRERDDLQKRTDSLEEYLRLLAPEDPDQGRELSSERDEETDQEELLQEMLPVLMTRRLLFIGGGQDLLARLRRQFPSAVFVENETQQASLTHTDYVIMFPRNMSHALFYKYIEPVRSQGIPVIYCNYANYERAVRTICRAVKKEQEHDS